MCRLVSSFYDAIDQSTPHLYVSALTWLPEKSPLKRLLYPYFTNQPFIVFGRILDWHSTLWMNATGGRVWQVDFSPDSQYLAACSDDGTIHVCEAKSGLTVAKLRGHADAVYTIAFSLNGKQLVSGSADCTVRTWDLADGSAMGKPMNGHENTVSSVCYSPDGRFIVSRSLDRTVRIWDSTFGTEVKRLNGYSEYGRAVYSPDGSKLACCGLEGIAMWEAQAWTTLGSVTVTQAGHINCIAFSPKGTAPSFEADKNSVPFGEKATQFT